MSKNRKLVLIGIVVLFFIILCIGIFLFNKSRFSFMNSNYILVVGDKIKLELNEDISGKYVWSSSDESVVIINSDGSIEAVGDGKATITVKVGNRTASCVVVVNNINDSILVEDIELSETEIFLSVGEEKKLEYVILPNNATNKNVSWYSSNEDVVSVKNGNIVALKSGISYVAVSSGNGIVSSCKVVVYDVYESENEDEVISVESINFSSDKITINQGESVYLDYNVSPENKDFKFIWSSSNNDVATVSSDGVVLANNKGVSVITITSLNGVYDTIEIIVVVPIINPDSISFNKSEFNLVLGDEIQLSVIYSPTNTNVKSIKWSSSNSNVAAVNDKGVISSKGIGTSTITATSSNGKVASLHLNVVEKKVEVEKISLNHSSYELEVGSSIQLIETLFPSNTTNNEVVWSSSDDSIVSVDNNGVIAAKKVGSATITVKTVNGKSATSKISVVKKEILVSEIKTDKSKVSLLEGESVSVVTSVLPSNAVNKILIWKSSNESVAIVDSNGKITGKSAGNAVVTVESTNGKTSIINVVVQKNDIAVASISLDKTEVVLTVGDKLKVYPTILPSDASNKNIVWSSGNSNVASVSQDGVITAKWGGVSTITAKTANGKTAKIVVTVKNYNLILDHQFLSTNGKNIVMKNGKIVVLRGFNLGVWLSRSFSLMQIAPLASNEEEFNKLGYSCINNIAINQILTKRFGKSKADELSNILYKNFITEEDLYNISQTGANVIRMPFEYSFFLNEDGSYKNGTIDFTYLDWIVTECRKRGIYVILDLHVGPGRQNSGGWCTDATFFANTQTGVNNRKIAIDLWKKIAEHYKGNPAVAGYDLINEPETSSSLLISFYDEAYKAIRSVDSDHIIFMEENCVFCGSDISTGRPNSVGDLPNPSTKGWKNVVYSTHDYFYNRDENGSILNTDDATLKRRILQKTQNTVKKMNDYNVPYYIGEFSHLNNTEVWKYAMNLYDSYSLSYTPWTYKASWDPYFGLVFYGRKWINGKQVPKVNLLTASYDEIKKAFSYKSTEAFIFNENFYRTFLSQFGGRVGSSINLSKNSITLNKNESFMLNYTVTPNNSINKNVVWKSSNPSIATVDSNTGKIIAKSSGTAIITATLKPLLLSDEVVSVSVTVIVK